MAFFRFLSLVEKGGDQLRDQKCLVKAQVQITLAIARKKPYSFNMTTKHFVKVAAIIAAMPDHSVSLRYCKESAYRAFSSAFKKDFPKFNAEKFRKACGINQ